jgi:metal-responsive CopG/Arc/MetJ family transcriptional regulator
MGPVMVNRRKKRVEVQLPIDLVDNVDRLRGLLGVTRTRMIRNALEAYLKKSP